jgi:hypothetical protein
MLLIVREHQNFCLRAKGGAYVVMDFRKEFDLSLEMILHIRHGCMLATGNRNASSSGFSVVSPTLSPSGNQHMAPPVPHQHNSNPQLQQQLADSLTSNHHRSPQSRMLQRDTSGGKRSPQAGSNEVINATSTGHNNMQLQPQVQNVGQQLELDPLNKILPQGAMNGPQVVITLTREVSTLAPSGVLPSTQSPPEANAAPGSAGSAQQANDSAQPQQSPGGQQQLPGSSDQPTTLLPAMAGKALTRSPVIETLSLPAVAEASKDQPSQP